MRNPSTSPEAQHTTTRATRSSHVRPPMNAPERATQASVCWLERGPTRLCSIFASSLIFRRSEGPDERTDPGDREGSANIREEVHDCRAMEGRDWINCIHTSEYGSGRKLRCRRIMGSEVRKKDASGEEDVAGKAPVLTILRRR